MKKILTLFAVVGLIVFSSCEGPEGPPGPPGPATGAVFENLPPNYYNFTSTNDYSVGFDFPVPLVDSDVVLVYRYDGVDNGGRKVWQALPETYYLADGTREFSFKYIFTFNYVDIYLDGKNRASAPAAYRLNQIFRIVIVPADFVAKVNTASYLDVINKLNIQESQIHDIKL
ncbi:hypothetical protein ACHRV1_08810 [Flavobacterium aquidurense]|uniref:hypothetical protein n=1 Tax=Flavobacterium aquidurense TaxID=362413 RepID=UPI0037563F10